MTDDEAIAFWYGRINYETRPAAPEDLKLERMRALLARLGHPERRLRMVHIAGTKGKGSTAAMMASILRTAGYRVGLFTSPHLEHVRERMQVDGEPITPAELSRLMNEVAVAVTALDAEPGPARVTFFEISTALGLLHFVRRRVDCAIIEVGLGGRFDSTNVITPLVSVITSIGLDHTQQLGHTVEKIAFQKAGIIKPGVPTVSGVVEPGPRAVIESVATTQGSRLRTITASYDGPIALLGRHQARNAAVAIAAISELQSIGMSIPDSAIATGLTIVAWPARVEVIAERPAVILDCAHNVPSTQSLVATLRQRFPDAARRHCIFAVSSDKPFTEILRELSGYFDTIHLTRYGNNPRGVPPETLAALLPPTVRGNVAVPASRALESALTAIGPADLVCVTGSVFLAGELAATLRQTFGVNRS
jgi:dihydrofolate synthase / folylpolyglutamate synthase